MAEDAVETGTGALAAGGGWRYELKDEMNSNACDESPNKFFRCSAAASLGRVSVYVMICPRESSSSGNSF